MENRFAGFWVRFVAYVIDSILLSVIQTIVFIFAALLIGIYIPFINEPETTGQFTRFVAQYDYETYDFISVSFLGLLGVVSVSVSWLYFAIQESSRKQATLGKAAMGLIVVDENFERISFLRATVRYFSKIISAAIFYIGYIMAGLNSRKRALHDIIAGTYVIRRDSF